jgi:hypothetical protein
MDRTIVLDQHIIEAWGLWWAQWQNETKERLRRQAMSPQMRLNRFNELHLVGSREDASRDCHSYNSNAEHLVGSQSKGLRRDST